VSEWRETTPDGAKRAYCPTEILREEVTNLAEGTVKWFNEKKGYGFIEQDEGGDLFVHYSSIAMPGFKRLVDGERVRFDLEDTGRGPQAINVTRIER
jgi:CspA family cold shock protein